MRIIIRTRCMIVKIEILLVLITWDFLMMLILLYWNCFVYLYVNILLKLLILECSGKKEMRLINFGKNYLFEIEVYYLYLYIISGFFRVTTKWIEEEKLRSIQTNV